MSRVRARAIAMSATFATSVRPRLPGINSGQRAPALLSRLATGLFVSFPDAIIYISAKRTNVRVFELDESEFSKLSLFLRNKPWKMREPESDGGSCTESGDATSDWERRRLERNVIRRDVCIG